MVDLPILYYPMLSQRSTTSEQGESFVIAKSRAAETREVSPAEICETGYEKTFLYVRLTRISVCSDSQELIVTLSSLVNSIFV